MHPFPHLYNVKVNASPKDHLLCSSKSLPSLTIAPPIEFDGPGDAWSPEDLFMASIANCFVLSFRAITKASRFDWLSIECRSEGVLDKVDRKVQFTEITNKVTLTIENADNIEKAERLLNKAEETCLISNSLTATSHLECEIFVKPS